MVCDQIGNTLDLLWCEVGIRKEALHQLRTFRLLMLAIRIAVFLTAQGAGNIMQNGGGLQKKQGLLL